MAQSDPEVCSTSGPDTGLYGVEICITSPDNRAKLFGDSDVRITIDDESGTLPQIETVEFYLAKNPSTGFRRLLTDYAEPYGLSLPTDRFVDGNYRLQAVVEFVDDFESNPAEINLMFDNNVDQEPASTGAWQPATGTPGNPFEIAVVGDGAGGLPGADAVGELVTSWDPNLLLYLGDVYNSGTYTEFHNYYDSTLGNLKEITNPVPGNHEAGGAGFQGYFDYWDTLDHYYAVDVAGWNLIALDSTDPFHNFEPGSPQVDWLTEQLEAGRDGCTIVFMHHPRWGLNRTGGTPELEAIWGLMADYDVEIALTGHEHNYQRWQPMNASGAVDPAGVTQFVVGTGGHDLEPFVLGDARVAAAVERVDGAMRMELSNTGATYEFVSAVGEVLDSGAIECAVPQSITLAKPKSKPTGANQAILSGFMPDSDITLTLEGGETLAVGRTDDAGEAVVRFQTPVVPQGRYQVIASDQAGNTSAASLSVIPSIKHMSTSVAAGAILRLNLAGFPANSSVEIRWSAGNAPDFEVLTTVQTNQTGQASVDVEIPLDASPGSYRIAGKVSGSKSSGSDTIDVVAAE